MTEGEFFILLMCRAKSVYTLYLGPTHNTYVCIYNYTVGFKSLYNCTGWRKKYRPVLLQKIIEKCFVALYWFPSYNLNHEYNPNLRVAAFCAPPCIKKYDDLYIK